MRYRILCLALLLALSGTSLAGTVVIHGTTTDPTGMQVDKHTITVDREPYLAISISYVIPPVDYRPWLDVSYYLFAQDGTPIAAAHNNIYTMGTFGIPTGGISPVPLGDYYLYYTAYNNRPFDKNGNDLFLPDPIDPAGHFYDNYLPNPLAGPLDHFGISGSIPGQVHLGEYEIIVTTASVVPEPTTIILFAIGGIGVVGYARRWRSKRPSLTSVLAHLITS
jgi:hypothetical protein